MSTTPEEYFGPHAKRWTSPTGEVLSLRPADYDRMVNTQMELDFAARELERLQQELAPAPEPMPEAERQARAIADIYGVDVVKHADWPNVISMDTAYDRIDPETAALFKDRGALIVPENPTSEQVSHDVDPDFAERLSGGTLRHASLVKGKEFGHAMDGWLPREVLAEGDHLQVFSHGQASHYKLDGDGNVIQIHPVPAKAAGEEPARRRRFPLPARAAAALGLVVIIIIIGVAFATGVMS